MSSSGEEQQLLSSDDLFWRPFLDGVGTRGRHETSFSVENILRRDSFPRQPRNVCSLVCYSTLPCFLPWSGPFIPEHLKPLDTAPCIAAGQETDFCLDRRLHLSSSDEVKYSTKKSTTSSLLPSETNEYPTSIASNSTSSASSSNVPPSPPTPQLPYWIYCTRYSDRPSAGPRSKRRVSEGSRSSSSTASLHRIRTQFSDFQVQVLEHEYARCHYLTDRMRARLAAELRLSLSQVQVWFQNRRAKSKRDHKKTKQVQQNSASLNI